MRVTAGFRTSNRRMSRWARWLFAVTWMRAIVVFTANPEFGLTVARLAHIFSTAEVLHLIVVTAADAVAEETACDLRWLNAPPEDGRVEAGTRPSSIYSGRELAPGVTAVPFDTVCPLSFLDPDVWPERSNGSDPAVYWSEWLGSRLALPARVRDVVLFVRPDWARCGSATTFRNLANYFRGTGWIADRHRALAIPRRLRCRNGSIQRRSGSGRDAAGVVFLVAAPVFPGDSTAALAGHPALLAYQHHSSGAVSVRPGGLATDHAGGGEARAIEPYLPQSLLHLFVRQSRSSRAAALFGHARHSGHERHPYRAAQRDHLLL